MHIVGVTGGLHDHIMSCPGQVIFCPDVVQHGITAAAAAAVAAIVAAQAGKPGITGCLQPSCRILFAWGCVPVNLFCCSEIDACEPYVKYSNGSVVSFPLTNYFEIDAQAVVTGITFKLPSCSSSVHFCWPPFASASCLM